MTTGNRIRIADLLSEVEDTSFVGREEECAAFLQSVKDTSSPLVWLSVEGPGGIGKSALLRRFATIATSAGVPVALLDASTLEPAPAILQARVAESLGENPLERLDSSGRFVLMFDGFETLSPLTNWFFGSYMPELPRTALVVTAARRAPPIRSVPTAVRSLSKVLRLRNLAPDEITEALTRRAVDSRFFEEVKALTLGHPLALAIAADAIVQSGTLGIEERAEVIAALLDRILDSTPDPKQRFALEMASHARVTSEALLVEVFGEAEGAALFRWLRGLSFMDVGPEGLLPHDLAREVIHHDLFWRNRTRFGQVHQRVRAFYVERYSHGSRMEREAALRDLVYLHRLNPILSRYFEFRTVGQCYAEPANEHDHEAIVSLVDRHEGAEAASAARHWLRRQPGAFIALRDGRSPLAGFFCSLDLTAVTAADEEADSTVALARSEAERRAPVRPGEAAIFGRFLIAAETYQQPSPELTVLQIQSYLGWLTTPALSWSFLVVARDAGMDDLFRYIDFESITQLPSAEGRSFTLYAHDWRKVNPAAWLQLMEAREIDTELRPSDLRAPAMEMVVLSPEAFREAVRDALRNLRTPASLARSPLLRSGLLARSGGPSSYDRLVRCILDAAEAMRAEPKSEKFFRALEVTYLKAAPTQELAAERLGLPFGTYRYRLSVATDRIADRLWEQELASAG
ncbi:MAG: ATP-binding protein [Bauldia sp.]|nr:ATP-binding protein [Bauldia sp.]MCW5719223.1 ATP-binding protein [Bauldia sp.]